MRGSPRPRFRRIVVAAAIGVVALGASAAPASAHTVGGDNATDYRTRILSVRPGGHIRVRAVDNGNRLELTNGGPSTVIVLGYDGEPYLRVGRRGVFENMRSPATYLNRTQLTPAPPPKSADPTAPPQWRKVSGGSTVRWHDHRAHWMSTVAPPAVARDPGHAHLIQRFRLVLERGGDQIVVRGDVWWIPGPSPWPWIAIAAAVAVLVIVLARTRFAARALGTALVVAALSATIHTVGSWPVGTASNGGRFGSLVPTMGAVALAIVALVQLVRRGLRAAAPLLVFSGLFLGIAVGLADLSAFSKSQLPTDLAHDLDRLTIALTLGGGLGITVGAALHVSERSRRRSARPVPQPGSGVPPPRDDGDRSRSVITG